MAAPVLRGEVLLMQRLAREEALSPPAIAARLSRTPRTVRRALTLAPEQVPEQAPEVVGLPAGAGETSRRARAERAMLRARLATGELVLADVLTPVHPLVADLPLAEVARWRCATSRGRNATPAMEELGRDAVRDKVNLMAAAGRASAYSRGWVAEHGEKWAQRRRRAA